MTSSSGTWWKRKVPSICFCPSTTFGPVQPFSVRRTMSGQAGGSSTPFSRASAWMRRMAAYAQSSVSHNDRWTVSGFRALDEAGVVAAAAEIVLYRFVAHPAEEGWAGDLVAVEVEDRQDGAVAGGVQEPVRLPAPDSGAGLRFPVADDAGDDEVGVVEGRADGMRERGADLAALVDRAGRMGVRRWLARRPANRTPAATSSRRLRRGAVRIDLRQRPFQEDVGAQSGGARPGPAT